MCIDFYWFFLDFQERKSTHEGFRASTPFCESSRTSNRLQTRGCSCPATVALCIHRKDHISRCEWTDRMYISSSLSIATPFEKILYCNTTLLQYSNIAILEYHGITTLQYYSTAILQYYNISIYE